MAVELENKARSKKRRASLYGGGGLRRSTTSLSPTTKIVGSSDSQDGEDDGDTEEGGVAMAEAEVTLRRRPAPQASTTSLDCAVYGTYTAHGAQWQPIHAPYMYRHTIRAPTRRLAFLVRPLVYAPHPPILCPQAFESFVNAQEAGMNQLKEEMRSLQRLVGKLIGGEAPA